MVGKKSSGNAFTTHKLIKLLRQIKKNVKSNRDKEFIAGFDYCRYMVELYIKENPSHNVSIEEAINDEYSKQCKKQLGKNLYNLLKKDRKDEVIKILEKWKNLI